MTRRNDKRDSFDFHMVRFTHKESILAYLIAETLRTFRTTTWLDLFIGTLKTFISRMLRQRTDPYPQSFD